MVGSTLFEEEAMTENPQQILVVPKEPWPGERRVAATADTVKDYVSKGFRVIVEPGAGAHSLMTDQAYSDAGAEVRSFELSEADIFTHVRPLSPEMVAKLRPGTTTVGFATGNAQTIAALRDRKITSLAMELVPRISRAQSMDALTSQALVSGYRCVLEAAMRLPRFFPLFMTAAGTVPPAKVLVLGAGVAGLQAIATAKRLGGQVSANDIRSASADEVRSMGGTFIDLSLESADGGGGYAKELGSDSAARQQELLTPYLAKSDVVITTAGVPGRPAPRLVTSAMLSQMKPGSVIVDLLAENGGNVEGSRPGEDIRTAEGVLIVGMKDVASTMPVDASRLYAKNIYNLLALGAKDGVLTLDLEDEVITGALLTHDGTVRHAPSAALLEGGAK